MVQQDRGPILAHDDALSLWVGRVARTHARLEYNLDNVYRFLVRKVGDAPERTAVRGFDQLASESQSLLGQSNADPEIVAAGSTALLAAKDATGIRNRVVHDLWLPDPLREEWEPPRWNTFRRSGHLQESYTSASIQDLALVVDAHALLERTCLRVSGLFMALHAAWPADGKRGGRSPQDGDLARYVALMTDRFTLHANGDFDVI